MAGRKSIKDELDTAALVNRLCNLSEQFYDVIEENLQSGVKSDKKWAVEQLGKLYGKILPTKIEGSGEGGAINVNLVNYGNNYSLPVQSTELSVGVPIGKDEVQDSGVDEK